jgi:hypothetical protein
MIIFILILVGHKIESFSSKWGRPENLRFGRGMRKIVILYEQCHVTAPRTLQNAKVTIKKVKSLCLTN